MGESSLVAKCLEESDVGSSMSYSKEKHQHSPDETSRNNIVGKKNIFRTPITYLCPDLGECWHSPWFPSRPQGSSPDPSSCFSRLLSLSSTSESFLSCVKSINFPVFTFFFSSEEPSASLEGSSGDDSPEDSSEDSSDESSFEDSSDDVPFSSDTAGTMFSEEGGTVVCMNVILPFLPLVVLEWVRQGAHQDARQQHRGESTINTVFGTGHWHSKECSVSRARSVAQHKPKTFASMTNNKQRSVEVSVSLSHLELTSKWRTQLSVSHSEGVTCYCVVDIKTEFVRCYWYLAGTRYGYRVVGDELRTIDFHMEKPPQFTDRDSSLDLPILGSLTQHETSALANYANETMKV
uniref:Uncharacterized protein n=1 Tax=Timema bartmani TaxID=61472 RepID=A0A7R9EQR5_9NEOP|nr:unnamed protein product [Timema bartmani]